MSDKELREIEERVNKATPGPWRRGTYNVWADGERPLRFICDTDTADAVRERFLMDQDDANCTFIAHARQDIPSLLETIRELQETRAFEKVKRHRFIDEALEITVEQDAELKAALVENEKLKARVAELEADARLGRMVREMPKYTELVHYGNGRFWYGHRISGFGKEGDTPEAALEAAQKETP